MTRLVDLMLDDDLEDFVNQQVSDGRYGSPDDVVDAALKLLQKTKEIEAIRAAIIDEEESGEPDEFGAEAFPERICRERDR
ncbi:type II toxin-antitoxin system ParD family antitoxin [Rhizobium sp. 18055]|uniref:type II toxin-antitoxin system ParD family antitoxin n=1 Tax=Rhizobium sp. 18055 TaxID=2681403 RepID=UPI00135C716E|nr:type II toxin-antitoxin system ParD family antitoxin [Rhizobium sp. 18055]